MLVGNKFNFLTVTEIPKGRLNSKSRILCKCECGKDCFVDMSKLLTGHTKSCGCLKIRKTIERNTTHGLCNSKKSIYNRWNNIKDRCYDKSNQDYKNYGGKGITLHKVFHDFAKFYEEIGDPPDNSGVWTIDRIDHTRNYEPGNLRWANHHQQARNRGKTNRNTSGFTGVSWYEVKRRRGRSLYALVQWEEYDKEKKSHKAKAFSVKKFGLLPAFAMACKYREDKIKELNAAGYGYSDNHGK